MMGKGRLEAFSDAVIAIIMTIMVLELKVPASPDLEGLLPLLPVFLTYALSFAFLAVYWNNHHHLLHAAGRIDGKILWANQHLLFWLSLVPFCTGWMGANHLSPIPTAAYGVVMLLSGIAYYLLQHAIIRAEGPDSRLATALGKDVKGRGSVLAYAVSVGCAFVQPWISLAIYLAVALAWFIPDRRLEPPASPVATKE